MFIVETQSGRKWTREPVEFADVEDAERYAEKLYKEGKTVRVVDERYRK